MDILNFISWIKGGRVVTTVDPAKTLLPVGLKDNRRDDGYLAGAISVEDLVTQLTPEPTYKVFTALLTQSGGDNQGGINWDDPSPSLVIGVTYTIQDNGGGLDMTNVGAPNNNINTSFVATETTPNSWGEGIVIYNTGAPVVTVLENTIGNVWFFYQNPGIYRADCFNGFTVDKTVLFSNPSSINGDNVIETDLSSISAYFLSYSLTTNMLEDNLLYKTPIEIRVYN